MEEGGGREKETHNIRNGGLMSLEQSHHVPRPQIKNSHVEIISDRRQ
jgi:hypothetical protein